MNEDIYEWTTEKLWNNFNQLYSDKLIPKEVYEKVKYGYNIRKIIHYFFDSYEWYEIYPEHEEVDIIGHGIVRFSVFIDEKELRESIMRKYIEENQDQSPTVGR